MAAPPLDIPDGPVHLLIRGFVQGVGFRAGMTFEARRLGARGWVRNRRSGAVEAAFDGTAVARAALAEWAQRGPDGSRVTEVEVRPASATEVALISAGFVQLPTD